MREVTSTERNLLYENRDYFWEPAFRKSDNFSAGIWIISFFLAIILFFAGSIGGAVLLEKLRINLPSGVIVSISLILFFSIPIRILPVLLAARKDKRDAQAFFLSGKLSVSGATLIHVEPDTITYYEDGAVDAEGKPYLSHARRVAWTMQEKEPERGDRFLLLYGENKKQENRLFIAPVITALQQMDEGSAGILPENIDTAGVHPDPRAAELPKTPVIPSAQLAQKLYQSSLQTQKQVQFKIWILSLFLCALLGGFFLWAWLTDPKSRTEGPSGTTLLLTVIGILAVLILGRLWGISRIKKAIPKPTKLMEAILLQYGPSRTAQVIVWRESQQNYVTIEYPTTNLFPRKYRPGEHVYLQQTEAGVVHIFEKIEAASNQV